MYQVVEIKRKHVTRSCVACKLRHHKCSGVSPCHYCIAKNQPCVFDVQAKRGPKKTKTNKGTNKEPAHLSSPSSPPPSSLLSSSSSPYCGSVSSSVVLNTQGFNNETNIFNNKEVNLWCENQRVVSVNSFFELRGWWKNLLDHDALRDSSSISFQVQSLVIGAHICRFHGDKSSALKLFQASQKLLDTIENEESVEYVCSRLLMVDFLPSNTVPFGLSAWNKVKNLELKTNRQKRIYTYAKMYAIMFMQKIEPPDDSVVIMAESDVWDILHLLIFKIANSFVFKMFSYDVHYLNQIKEHQLTPDKCDKMLADINMMNWIIHGHSDVFGPEFQIIIPMMTALILWKKGSLNEAVAEGVRYLCVLRNFGDKQVFLSDILNMSIPLLIFKDAGMTHLLREALDLLAPVAFSTEQHELYYDLVNFYLNSTLPPRKPHLQIIDDNNNNNNNNNKCNNSNNDNNIIVSYNLCSNNTNTNNYNNNSNNNNTHNSNIYSAANAIPISPICEDVIINNNNNNNNIINYNIEINNNNNNDNSNNIPSSLPSPTLLSNLLPLPAELDFLFIHDHSVLPLL